MANLLLIFKKIVEFICDICKKIVQTKFHLQEKMFFTNPIFGLQEQTQNLSY